MKLLFRKAVINGELSGKEIDVSSEDDALKVIRENNSKMQDLGLGVHHEDRKPILWLFSETQRGIVGWIIDT